MGALGELAHAVAASAQTSAPARPAAAEQRAQVGHVRAHEGIDVRVVRAEADAIEFFVASGKLAAAVLAVPLSEVAFKFGPAEYFSLMVLGLVSAVVLAHGSLVKAIAMILLGLLMGLVGGVPPAVRAARTGALPYRLVGAKNPVTW